MSSGVGSAPLRWQVRVQACRRTLIELVLPETPVELDARQRVKIRYALEQLEKTAVRYGLVLERARLTDSDLAGQDDDEIERWWTGPVTADEVVEAWRAVDERTFELELERGGRGRGGQP